MARNFITAIFFIIMAIIMMVNFMGCSDMFESPVPWPGDLEAEESEYDLDNNVVKEQDQSPAALQKNNITSLFELQKQQQNR